MIRRRLALGIAALGALLGAPPDVVAQRAASDTVGAWHRARLLRDEATGRLFTLEQSIRLARAELELGRPERARVILGTRDAVAVVDAEVLTLRGRAAYGVGEYFEAGVAFTKAAAVVLGTDRGVLEARAGDALARAGLRSDAARHYRAATALLVPLAGWLAVREAAVTDDAALAMDLLRQAPLAADRLASRVRAHVLLGVGDSARALTALARAGEWSQAAALALSLADTGSAHRYAYEAVRSADTSAVRRGLAQIAVGLVPSSEAEWFVVATGYNRLGDASRAIAAIDGAMVSGDSTSAALRRMGDLLASVGSNGAALAAYEAARARSGADGALADVRRARLLLRMGRTFDGYAALEQFALAHPDHPQAPVSLYIVADWRRRSGRTAEADSLLAAVAARWPNAAYADRARLALASSAMARADTAEALAWYRREISTGRAERRTAQYFLADLIAVSGDSLRAERQWARLAHSDSIGYWGAVARAAIDGAGPMFAPAATAPANRVVGRELQRLDLLRRAGFHEEERETVRWLLERQGTSVPEVLALAEGLIARGWVQEGVDLGWRAARVRTLHDPRVLRVVFPWPLRRLVEREAREHGIDPYLLAALIRQESNFRPAVVSRAGAYGIMQLMPATASMLAHRSGIEWDRRYLTSAEANLHLGAAHLAALLRQYDGDVIPALAAYNAGGTAVARWLRVPAVTDPVRFVESIPYVETRGYLHSVLRNWALYRALYPTPAPRGGTLR